LNPESDLAAGVLIYAKRRAETAEVIQCALESLQIIELHDFSDRIRETKGCPLTLLLPDAVAAMYFTSGMTGKPRCVMFTHRNMGSQICHSGMRGRVSADRYNSFKRGVPDWRRAGSRILIDFREGCLFNSSCSER